VIDPILWIHGSKVGQPKKTFSGGVLLRCTLCATATATTVRILTASATSNSASLNAPHPVAEVLKRRKTMPNRATHSLFRAT